MAAALLLCAVNVSLLVGQAAAPTADEIAAAIIQLGDDSFAVRQKATEWLWQAGPAAEPHLRAALKSTDPEVRTRAASVLDKLRFGLRPDTPPEIAVLIDQFRHGGNITVRQQALAALQTKGQWSVVLALLRGEPNAEERQKLATVISADAGKLLRPLIEKGDLDQAEQVLELTAMNDAGLAQLAVFLLITERLEPRIQAVRDSLATAPQEDDWRRLAALLRAKGDFSAAADAALKTSDTVFAANILSEAGRYAEAAKKAEEIQQQNKNMLDALAFAAAYYQLAGDDANYQRLIELLRKEANLDKPRAPAPADDPFSQNLGNSPLAAAWRLAETLLITEQVEPALEVLKKTHPIHAHSLLVRQHRHGEALEFVGVSPDKTLDRKWFDALPGGIGEAASQQSVRFALAAQVARELRELGRKEQITPIVETLRDIAAADGQRGLRWSALATLYWQLDQFDEAFAALEQALASNQTPNSAFSALLKTQGPLAAAWFGELTSRDPLVDRKAAIAEAVWLIVPQPPAGKLPANWHELVEKVASEARKLPAPQRGDKLLLPVEVYRLRGDLAAARKLCDEIQDGHVAGMLKAADLAASAGDWAAAANKYGQLASQDGSDPLLMFLHGHALTKAGQPEEGAKRVRFATLTSLSPDVRFKSATALLDRAADDSELKKLVAEQFELVRRTAAPDSYNSVTAAQRVGNVVNANEPQRAADCWRQLHLHILNSNSNFLESDGYLSLPQVIHTARARAALAANQPQNVQAELDRCEKLLPGDVRLSVDLAPKLDAAGMKAIADQVFERAMAAHQRVLADFPESPTFLNNAAWIAARGQRQLDAALDLAQRAVKVAPHEASYHDTLAEVHFQRGDREPAVAAAQKAAELSPHNKLFAKRLKHFQEDPVKTLDAPNE